MPKKKENRNEKLKSGSTKIAAGGTVGFLGIRSGLPRALGVRLETHSTTKKKAKEILKNGGYLDPNRSGESAVSLLKDFDPEKYQKAKNKVYVTGVHPDQDKGLKILGLLNRNNQRAGYRAQAGREKEINDIRKKYGFVGANAHINEAIPEHEILGGMVGLKGRTLYVGGSDEYFRKNFSPDFDDVTAMYSDKKVKVYGNRAAATVAAVRREGLKNLLKGDKKRIITGAAILGASGLAAGKLIHSGATDVKSYIRNGKTVKGYKRNGKKNRIKR